MAINCFDRANVIFYSGYKIQKIVL